MRRLGLIGLAFLLLAAPVWAARGTLLYKQVDCTTTASHVVGSQSGRTALTLQNVGTINVYLGGPLALELRSDLGFTLHAGSVITFGQGVGDPTVGVRCIADGPVRVQILEEF